MPCLWKAVLCISFLIGVACDTHQAPPPAKAPTPFEADKNLIRIAGTGAMIPLASQLASAWNEKNDNRIVVEKSIGSSGGVRATLEGAVDIGMLSRPLQRGEKALGLAVVPVARDAVVFAVNREVEVENLNTAELLSIYSGQQTEFADNTPVSLLLRDRRESANFAMDRMVPALAKIREANYRHRRFRVIYHEDAMAVALATTPGGMGLLSMGAIHAGRLPIKALSLNGIRPSLKTIEDGSWPATRKLAFIVRPDRLAAMEQFLRFVSSADGRSIIQASGYLSLPEDPKK